MSTLNTDVGYEVLAQANKIKVSRFSVRIRIMHWFNAGMILLLYYLGFSQLFELSEMNFFGISDARLTHFKAGQTWVVGMLILGFIASIKHSLLKSSITTDQLVIKQRVFLVASVILMSLMAITGLSMFWLRPYDLPNLRGILLLIHDMIAFSYLPILMLHLYLAIFSSESRQSLKTMFRDVYTPYIVNNEIEGLSCYLTDNEKVIFIHAQVLQFSIAGFQIIVPKGEWQRIIDLRNITTMDFIHPELDAPLRMKAKMDYSQLGNDKIFAKFRFTTTIQESSRLLLSKAIFFRSLFLSRRTQPRMNCNLPVETRDDNNIDMGVLVNISYGGAGFLSSKKLVLGKEISISITLKNPEIHLKTTGNVVISDHISANELCHGISFSTLSAEQRLEITKILGYIRLREQQIVRHD